MRKLGSLFLLIAVLLTVSLSASTERKAKEKKKEVAAAVPASVPAQPAPRPFDPLLLKNVKARSIGPAVMGGRVSDIALDPQDPYTFYIGLGTGGIMKTSDNGGTFQAVFEKEGVAAIGAISVAPSDPKVIWVGSGEANDRNSES